MNLFPLSSNFDSRSSFFGRGRERQRLQTALENKRGGTILIAGDRGSGKTSLVNDVLSVKKIQRKKYSPFKLTRDYFVQADLPFIPKHVFSTPPANSDDDKTRKEYELRADVTSLVLRALAQTLVSENEQRRRSKLDIRRKWFRPLGYNRELKELDRLTRYVAIKETRSRSLSSPQKTIYSQAYQRESELDLSDTIIEVRLRKLLQTYSKSMSFVFVFDELDKEENKNVAIKLATYLKNLFTQCGAHFIFITSEETYGYIENRSVQQPYSEAHTLFTEKILLNQLALKPFDRLFTDAFTTVTLRDIYAEDGIPAFTLSLAWKSKNHPFDAISTFKRALNHNDGRQALDLKELRDEIGEETWIINAGLQLIIDHLIEKLRETGDDYYNRYLYKALRVAAENISTSPELLINTSNMLSALYQAKEFNNNAEEINQKDAMDFNAPPKTVGSKDTFNDWRKNLYALGSYKARRIEEAIMELLWLIDRAQAIGWKPAAKPSGEESTMFVCAFKAEAFSLEHLLEPSLPTPSQPKTKPSLPALSLTRITQDPNYGEHILGYLYETSSIEQKLLKESLEVNKVKPVFHHNVWDYYDPKGASFIKLGENGIPEIDGPKLRQRFTKDINRYADNLKGAEQEARDQVLEDLQKTIMKIYPNVSFHDSDFNYTALHFANERKYLVVRFNSSPYIVQEDLDKQYSTSGYPLDPHSVSIINIQESTSIRAPKQSDKRVKNYRLLPDWSNLNQLKANVVTQAGK